MITIAMVMLHLMSAGMNFTAEDIIQAQAQQPYIPCNDYNQADGCYYCHNFANDLKTLLERAGTKSYIVYGLIDGGGHYWNAAMLNGTWQFIEPQTGKEAKKPRYKLIGVYANYTTRQEVMAAWKSS